MSDAIEKIKNMIESTVPRDFYFEFVLLEYALCTQHNS